MVSDRLTGSFQRMMGKMTDLKRLAERYGVILIALVGGLIYILCLDATVAGHDRSRFIILARSIATGQGFRDLSLPGSPPYTLAPFGYPLLLAPVMVLFPHFPENIIPLKLVTVSFGVVNILMVYWLFRSLKVEIWLALLLVSAVALAPLTIVFATHTLSEAPYLLFSLLALLLLGKWVRDDRMINPAWLLGVLAMAMAYLTRVVGLSLLAAGLGYLLLRKRWKHAVLTGLLFALLISPWAYRNMSVGSSGLTTDYVQSYFVLKDMARPYLGTIGPGDLMQRLLNNVRGHATDKILWLFFPWAINGWWPAFLSRVHLESLTWVSPVLGLAVSALCILGYVVSLRKRLRVDHLYVVFYLGIILLPPWVVERNLWPLLPFLLYYFVVGLRWLVERASLLWRKSVPLTAPATVVALCIVLLGFAMSDRHLLAAGAAYRVGQVSATEQSFFEMCEWIRRNTAADDLIMYFYADKLYLYTGRKTTGIPAIIDRDAFLEHLYDQGVDYVAIEPSRQDDRYGGQEQIYLQPAVMTYPQAFVPVHQIGADPDHPAFVVYSFEGTLGEEQ